MARKVKADSIQYQLHNQRNKDLVKKQDFNTLAIETKQYLLKMISKYGTFQPETVEDLLQEAQTALYKAMLTYDEAKNNNFMLYAGVFIRNEIAIYLLKHKNTIRLTSTAIREIKAGKSQAPLYWELDRKFNEELDDEGMKQVSLELVNEIDNTEIEIEGLKEAIKLLNPEEQELIKHHYGLDEHKQMLLKEYAQMKGLTNTMASYKYKRILIKIRSYMNLPLNPKPYAKSKYYKPKKIHK
jgi:RNA polymerase sporulation-specific sigma factor